MSSITTDHLVEVRQYTGGAALHCHGCSWKADINTGAIGTLRYAELRGLAWEARALADAHRYGPKGAQ